MTGGTDAPQVQGYINPKYLIVGVTYAPPGSQSFVQYTDSAAVGNTASINSSFGDQTSVTTSVMFGTDIFGFANGKETDTSTTNYGQTSSSSNSVTITQTQQVSDKTFGPTNSFVGWTMISMSSGCG